MVAPSKLLEEPINCYHCSQLILHPGIGCPRYFLNNLFWFGVSCLKYFLPLLLTPLILKYKKMNREILCHIVKHYLQTVFWSSLASASVFAWICCFRNLLGKFHRYTAFFIPSVLGMQFCWFFPPRVLKLFTTSTTQATIETLLLQNPNKLTRLILHSTPVQTIIFMLNSAIILHFKRKNIYKEFWFIEPHEKINHPEEQDTVSVSYKEKPSTNCHHKNTSSCRKFVLDGMKSYLLYGISLDILSMLMKNRLRQGAKSFMGKIKGRLSTFRPYMTAFFLSYVGIYRLSSCIFRKYNCDLSLDVQHLMSAFMGGFSFIFLKRTNFLLFSVIISIQLLWQQFCSSIKSEQIKRKPNLVLIMLKNAPISEILFPVNVGYLLQNYILNYHLISNFGKGLLDGISYNKLKNIRNVAVNNDIQSLIEMGKLHPIRILL